MRDRVWRQHWEKQQQQYPGGSHQSTKSKSGEILAALLGTPNVIVMPTWIVSFISTTRNCLQQIVKKF